MTNEQCMRRIENYWRSHGHPEIRCWETQLEPRWYGIASNIRETWGTLRLETRLPFPAPTQRLIARGRL